MNIEATRMSGILDAFRGICHKLYSMRNRTQIVYLEDKDNKDIKKSETSDQNFKKLTKPISNAWMLSVIPEEEITSDSSDIKECQATDYKKVINRTLSAPVIRKELKAPFVRSKSESDVCHAPRSDKATKALESYKNAIANLELGQNKYEAMAAMHIDAVNNPNIDLNIRINHFINAVSDLNIALQSGSISAARSLDILQKDMKHIMHLSNANDGKLDNKERIAEFNKAIPHLQNAIFEGDDGAVEMLRSILNVGLRISASSDEYLVNPDKEAATFLRQMQEQSIRMRNMGYDEMLKYDSSNSHLSYGEMRFHRAAFLKEVSIHYMSSYAPHSDLEEKIDLAKNLFMKALSQKGQQENYYSYKSHILNIE